MVPRDYARNYSDLRNCDVISLSFGENFCFDKTQREEFVKVLSKKMLSVSLDKTGQEYINIKFLDQTKNGEIYKDFFGPVVLFNDGDKNNKFIRFTPGSGIVEVGLPNQWNSHLQDILFDFIMKNYNKIRKVPTGKVLEKITNLKLASLQTKFEAMAPQIIAAKKAKAMLDSINLSITKTNEKVTSLLSDLTIEKAPTNLIEKVTNEMNRIKNMDLVHSFSIDDQAIVIHTKEIICVNPLNKEKHMIGRCRILIQFNEKQPYVFNLDRKYDEHDHPHVRNNKPCMGNFSEIYNSLLRQREYSALISSIFAYLQTCNPHDAWGSTITYWPKVK